MEDGHALHLMGFSLQAHAYTEAKLNVQGVKNYQLFVNGRKHSQASGQKKANIKALADMGYNVIIKDDNSLSGDDYTIIEEGEKQCI